MRSLIGLGAIGLALTALAFAATVALLTRALLKTLKPVHAVALAAFAFALTAGHLLARPHVLAMPLLMAWTVGLVSASESGRAPRLWLLPVMTLWANLHGGFTLGLAFACVFALESVLAARQTPHFARTVRSWAIFLALAVAASLITPHGLQAMYFTWLVMFKSSYALSRVSEFQSPNFHSFQVLELWLLGGMALILLKGFRLPPIRLLLLLGLLHLALKHVRNVEFLGLLVPLFLATPLAAQWRQTRQTGGDVESLDRFFRKLAQPAGQGAMLLALGFSLVLPQWIAHARPIQAPESQSVALAIRAVQAADIKGPVLNDYGWGGYLIYAGVPTFIDGRADIYGDDFLKVFVDALGLTTSDGLEKLLQKHRIEWTLLATDSPAVALLDHLPEWRRLYADKTAVVHVKSDLNRAALPERLGLAGRDPALIGKP